MAVALHSLQKFDAAALKRKGNGSDVEEADMEAVVHAHNSEAFIAAPCCKYAKHKPICVDPVD